MAQIQQGTANDDKKIILEGDVTEILPGLEYQVKVNFKGIEHFVKCYISGKMKSHYIQLAKGDKVRVEISLYDIDKGRIVYRLTQRQVSLPPRRAKK